MQPVVKLTASVSATQKEETQRDFVGEDACPAVIVTPVVTTLKYVCRISVYVRAYTCLDIRWCRVSREQDIGMGVGIPLALLGLAVPITTTSAVVARSEDI